MIAGDKVFILTPMRDEFSDLFSHFCDVMDAGCAACPRGGHAFVVALSGGADSMALCHMAARWAACRSARGQATHIYAVTVDHGLRPHSAQEARDVGAAVAGFAALSHHVQTLRWPDGVPVQKVMEQARAARYAALAGFCDAHGVGGILLGHHRDDQAETVLFRLAKGSGIDGLGGMRAVQRLGGHMQGPVTQEPERAKERPGERPGERDVWLVRPLLDCGHEDLVAYCAAHGLKWVEDPSNLNEAFARPRLRGAREVLEREGLSAKRLAVTAGRLARAAAALDVWAQDVFGAALMSGGAEKNMAGGAGMNGTQGAAMGADLGATVGAAMGAMCGEGAADGRRVVLDWDRLAAVPEEITLRCLQKAMEAVGPQRVYAARLEKVEMLCARMRGTGFRRACLGGCVFSLTRGREKGGPHRVLSVTLEKTPDL